MNSKCDQKLLKTVAFSNVCICSGEPNQKEHTHFHPSGSLEPSENDLNLTKRLKMAGDLIGIELLDHIIVGGDNSHYFSFCENCIMPGQEQQQDKSSNITRMPIAAEHGRSR